MYYIATINKYKRAAKMKFGLTASDGLVIFRPNCEVQ